MNELAITRRGLLGGIAGAAIAAIVGPLPATAEDLRRIVAVEQAPEGLAEIVRWELGVRHDTERISAAAAGYVFEVPVCQWWEAVITIDADDRAVYPIMAWVDKTIRTSERGDVRLARTNDDGTRNVLTGHGGFLTRYDLERGRPDGQPGKSRITMRFTGDDLTAELLAAPGNNEVARTDLLAQMFAPPDPRVTRRNELRRAFAQ